MSPYLHRHKWFFSYVAGYSLGHGSRYALRRHCKYGHLGVSFRALRPSGGGWGSYGGVGAGQSGAASMPGNNPASALILQQHRSTEYISQRCHSLHSKCILYMNRPVIIPLKTRRDFHRNLEPSTAPRHDRPRISKMRFKADLKNVRTFSSQWRNNTPPKIPSDTSAAQNLPPR